MTADHPPPRRAGIAGWLLLAVTAALVVVARVNPLDLPLERDEGEFAVMGRMILDGIPPYAEAYNLKPPGIYLAYAGAMALFGETPAGIRVGLLLVNLLSAALLFLIARAVWSDAGATLGAALSAAAFLALSTMPSVLGFNAHATQVLLAPALGGFLCLLPTGGRSAGPGWILAGGILVGMSALVKQPGLVFALLGGLMVIRPFLVTRPRSGTALRRAALYLAGVAVPVVAALVWLSAAGVLDRFRFWVIDYALAYGSSVDPAEALDIAWFQTLKVAGPGFLLWILAAWGAVAPSEGRWPIVIFLAASWLAVSMGFHYRTHYFVLLLPALSLAAARGALLLGEFVAGRLRSGATGGRSTGGGSTTRGAGVAPMVAALMMAVAIAQVAIGIAKVGILSTPAEASRNMFGSNPFVESPAVGERINRMTGPEERIAVVGSEPQIYFLADRRPATGYLYTYSLVEPQPFAKKMREEMIAEIERAAPRVVVFVGHPTSWLLRPDSDLSIFTWWSVFRDRNGYRRVGVVEALPGGRTAEAWGGEAAGYRTQGEHFLEVWRN